MFRACIAVSLLFVVHATYAQETPPAAPGANKPRLTIRAGEAADVSRHTAEWVLIYDFTNTALGCPTTGKAVDLNAKRANRHYSFPMAVARDIGKPGATLLDLLNCGAGVTPCEVACAGVPTSAVPDPPPTVVPAASGADFAVAAALSLAHANVDRSTQRWFGSKNDRAYLYVFYEGQEPKLTHDEDPRKSRFQADVNTLLGVVAKIVTLNAPAERTYKVALYQYALTHKRANLKFELTQETTGGDDKKIESTIVTGPPEHTYLSADVALDSAKEAEFDRDANAVTPEDTSRVFAGINYSLGDLSGDVKQPFWRGLVLKGFVEASKTPLDSYGVGVGLRGDALSRLGIEFDAFSPFIAVMRVKEDVTEPDGTVRENARTRDLFRFGLSFNLDKLFDWVGPKEDDDEEAAK